MDNTDEIEYSWLDIVEESEGIEGYKYNASNVTTNSNELMKNINKETVAEFLKCEGTKISVKKTQNEGYVVVAHNAIANESVRIKGLGNHFVAFIDVVNEAKQKQKAIKKDPTIPIISHDLVKGVDEQILIRRYGELGIGNYRESIRDEVTNKKSEVNVALGRLENGKLKRVKCISLEKTDDDGVKKKMDELLNWVNNDAFKDKNKDKLMEDVAQFHARFIKIHPFRDGNGRTARLLTNYLLLVNGLPMINIPAEKRDEYTNCIAYSIADSEEAFVNENDEYANVYNQIFKQQGKRTDENKYRPLAKMLSTCKIPNCNELVSNIITYKSNDNDKYYSAEQIVLGE